MCINNLSEWTLSHYNHALAINYRQFLCVLIIIDPSLSMTCTIRYFDIIISWCYHEWWKYIMQWTQELLQPFQDFLLTKCSYDIKLLYIWYLIRWCTAYRSIHGYLSSTMSMLFRPHVKCSFKIYAETCWKSSHCFNLL